MQEARAIVEAQRIKQELERGITVSEEAKEQADCVPMVSKYKIDIK